MVSPKITIPAQKPGSDPIGCLCDVTKIAISIDLQPICRVT